MYVNIVIIKHEYNVLIMYVIAVQYKLHKILEYNKCVIVLRGVQITYTLHCITFSTLNKTLTLTSVNAMTL